MRRGPRTTTTSTTEWRGSDSASARPSRICTAWTLLLAGVAVALRFIPYSDHHGHYRAGWLALLIAIALVAIAASVYLVYVLEILKFKNRRATELKTADPDTTEHEIDERVRHDLETGEFERVHDAF